MKKPNQPRVERSDGGLSRRDLMRALGLSAGGAALFGGSALKGNAAFAASSSAAPVPRGAVGLVLDNSGTYLESSEGGNAIASVVLEPPDGAPTRRKRTGAIRYEDLRLQVGLAGMAPPLAAWVNNTMLKGPIRKSGALVYYDVNVQEMKRLEFHDAVLSEISLSESDGAAAGKPALITLGLAPSSTRLVGPGGSPVTFHPAASKVPQANLFRLSIQGLEAACRRVQKVSAISAKRTQSSAGGEVKAEDLSLTPLDCGLITITINETDAAPFYTWFADFALKGNNGRDGERPGRIEWVGANMAGIVTAELGNLGIVRYAPGAQRLGATATTPPTEIDMYCEGWSLRYG